MQQIKKYVALQRCRVSQCDQEAPKLESPPPVLPLQQASNLGGYSCPQDAFLTFCSAFLPAATTAFIPFSSEIFSLGYEFLLVQETTANFVCVPNRGNGSKLLVSDYKSHNNYKITV